MATKTFEELKQLAIQIRDEKTNKQNTATRVGTAMLEHINKLEQDYYDKTQTDEKFTELSKRNYTKNEALNSLIKEIYVIGANRGSTYIKNIHRQGGSTGDARGYIVVKVGENEYNLILDNPPRVADADNNIIKKTTEEGVTFYFLIDWQQLEPGTGTNNKEYFSLTSNAYTLSSNPQIGTYLSAEFHYLSPNDILDGKYVYLNGSILNAGGNNIYVYKVSSNRKYRVKGTLEGTTTFGVYGKYNDKELSELLYLYSKDINGRVVVDEIIQGYDGYLAVSWQTLNAEVYTDGIGDIISDVDDIKYRLATNTKIQKDGYSQGYINTSGQIIEHASYLADYYSLTPGNKYRILGKYSGVSGTATLSLWKGDRFIKAILNTNEITTPGSTINVDYFFTVPLGVDKAYITNTNGNSLFLYKVEELKNIVQTDNLESLLSKITVGGNLINPSNEILSKYLNSSGNYVENLQYVIREYSVKEGQEYKIKGSTRGTIGVACYALYKGEAKASNLVSIYTIKDFYGCDYEGAMQATIDFYIKVPENVTLISTCSVPEDADDMLLLDIANTKDYIDISLGIKYVDCLGDSLTMGASRFGWYEDTIQELLGSSNYKVRNWGVGGETSESIMARQGSDCVKFQDDWVLKADMTPTLVMDTDGGNITIKTQKYNTVVALLLQGAENDSGQQSRVVNPCYINGIKCTMNYQQGSGYSKGKWYIKRNEAGDRDITIPKNTPVYFNTGREMGKSEITIIWMGANDGTYSNWQDLVDKQIMAANKVSNKKFIVVGLHKLNKENGEQYEALMRNTFGNKFFNIREYMSTNMIYDAGIEPTEDDLEKMVAGECPQSLLYDGTHLKPESNKALGTMLYNLCVALGYIK